MSLPELLRRSAEKQLLEFCRSRSDCDPAASRLDFRVEDDHITLYLESGVEGDHPSRVVTPIGRLRFDPYLNQWTLHYPISGDRWSFYLNAGPSLDLGKLLQHIDRDPLHVFWPTTV